MWHQDNQPISQGTLFLAWSVYEPKSSPRYNGQSHLDLLSAVVAVYSVLQTRSGETSLMQLYWRQGGTSTDEEGPVWKRLWWFFLWLWMGHTNEGAACHMGDFWLQVWQGTHDAPWLDHRPVTPTISSPCQHRRPVEPALPPLHLEQSSKLLLEQSAIGPTVLLRDHDLCKHPREKKVLKDAVVVVYPLVLPSVLSHH